MLWISNIFCKRSAYKCLFPVICLLNKHVNKRSFLVDCLSIFSIFSDGLVTIKLQSWIFQIGYGCLECQELKQK